MSAKPTSAEKRITQLNRWDEPFRWCVFTFLAWVGGFVAISDVLDLIYPRSIPMRPSVQYIIPLVVVSLQFWSTRGSDSPSS